MRLAARGASRFSWDVTADVDDGLENGLRLVIVCRENWLGSFLWCEFTRGFHALLV